MASRSSTPLTWCARAQTHTYTLCQMKHTTRPLLFIIKSPFLLHQSSASYRAERSLKGGREFSWESKAGSNYVFQRLGTMFFLSDRGGFILEAPALSSMHERTWFSGPQTHIFADISFESFKSHGHTSSVCQPRVRSTSEYIASRNLQTDCTCGTGQKCQQSDVYQRVVPETHRAEQTADKSDLITLYLSHTHG
jgi:hypothetical protein